MDNVEYILDLIQVSLFFPYDINQKYLLLANALHARLENIFPNEPTILSLPIEAPQEIPRVIFNNDKSSLAISQSRADLLMSQNEHSFYEKSVEAISKLIEVFDEFKTKIVRFGIIIKFNIPGCDVNILSSYYIKNNYIKESSEINIGWHKIIVRNSINLNQWVKFNVSNIPEGNKNLLIDINTIVNDDLNLDKNELDKAIKDIIDYIGSNYNDIINGK